MARRDVRGAPASGGGARGHRASPRGVTDTKTFYAGTHRTADPRDTWQRWWRLRSAFGITRLADVTGLDYVGIPTFMAVRPNARSLSVSQGKGITRDAAKASALMESIELWHAEHVELPTQTATYRELAGSSDVVRIDHLDLLPDRRPEPDTAYAWVLGTDLLTDRPVWVPRDCITVSATEPPSTTFTQTSNGLASGNTHAEALVHAICELVERDAYSLWQADPDDPDGTRTQLDLGTVADPHCVELLRRYEAAGLLVAVHDMTSDVGVPAYTCLISDRPGNFRALGYDWGAGAHLSPAVALSRALTEAAQSRLTTLAGARDDIDGDDYRQRDEDDLRDLEHQILASRPTVGFDRLSLATETLSGDLTVLLDRVRAVGVESLVAVDLTRSEFGVPVVKVVATQLEGPYGVSAPNARARAVRGGPGR